MTYQKQGALWMPQANGVGSMSAGFGAGAVYPFKGNYLAVFQPQQIQTSGSNISVWPSLEGPLSLSPVGTVTPGIMPDGVSKCASFAAGSDALSVTDVFLQNLGGINTSWLMVCDYVLDTKNAGSRVCMISRSDLSMRINDWIPDSLTSGQMTRQDGVATNVTVVPDPQVLGTRVIKGYLLDSQPSSFCVNCNPVTGAITVGVQTLVTTALSFTGINNLTFNGFSAAGHGNIARLANLYIKLPSNSSHNTMLAEMNLIMQYIRLHPNG